MFVCSLTRPVYLFSAARNSDSKWSPGTVTNTSLAHELWKVPLPHKGLSAPSRPPPGLTGQKPPPSSWDNGPLRLAGWSGSESRFTPGQYLGSVCVCVCVRNTSSFLLLLNIHVIEVQPMWKNLIWNHYKVFQDNPDRL